MLPTVAPSWEMSPICDLILAACLTIHGPGAIGYSAILDDVAERRTYAGWGLSADWTEYDVLLGVPDCDLLNYEAWLIAGGKVIKGLIVDCAEGLDAEEMIARGLLADMNKEELNHESGWLVVKKNEGLLTPPTPHPTAPDLTISTPHRSRPHLARPNPYRRMHSYINTQWTY